MMDNTLNIFADDALMSFPILLNSYPPSPSPYYSPKCLWKEDNQFTNEQIIEVDSVSSKVKITNEGPFRITKTLSEVDQLANMKSKRGRKRILYKDETEEVRKIKRAERNKMFSQESRDRKRQYISELEKKVDELNNLLSYYKSRYEKYEIIEKEYEELKRIEDTTNNLKDIEVNQKTSENAKFLEEMIAKSKIDLLNRCNTIKELTKIMLKISMPFSTRFSVWFATNAGITDSMNKIDIYEPEKLRKMFNNAISLDKAKEIIKYAKKIHPTYYHYKNMQTTMEQSGNKIKACMRQVIECQRNVQLE